MNTLKYPFLILFCTFIFGQSETFAQVSVHTSADCEVHATEADISLGGDCYNNGTFYLQSSRLVFNGDTDQYMHQVAGKSLQHLMVDKPSGALYLTDSLFLSDSLTLLAGRIMTNPAAPLLLSSSARTSGGTHFSFVEGPLGRTYNVSGIPETFEFPVGDGTDFRPLSIEFGTVSGDSLVAVVEQVNEDPQQFSQVYAGMDRVSTKRYFQIGTSGSGTFTNARVTLTYDTVGTDDGVEIGDELKVAQLDTTFQWTWVNAGGIGSADYAGTITSMPLSDLESGRFTFGDAEGGGDISLPVALNGFKLSDERGEVFIAWRTESEINNSHWQVQRKLNEEDENFETIGRLDGRGSTHEATEYEYSDSDVSAGKEYIYRLVDVSFSGRVHIHPEEKITVGLPATYALYQNFPNPFNATTKIRYDLPASSEVKLQIFNILGQSVVTLVDGKQEAGFYKMDWNSTNNFGHTIASGMYIVAIRAEGKVKGEKKRFHKVKKIMLLK